MPKLPDYAHLLANAHSDSASGHNCDQQWKLTVCSVKTSCHQHGDDGPYHIEIDVMVDPNGKIFVNQIRQGFDEMMHKLSGNDPINSVNYEGAEAEAHYGTSIADYHAQFAGVAKSKKDSN